MRYIFLVFLLCCFNFFAQGQSFNYVKGTLDITIEIFNPCGSPAPNNGHIEFTTNAADGGAATLIFLDGPGANDVISPVTINVGSTFSFNATNTLPDGVYNFIIRDQLGNETINTFAEPIPYPPLNLIDIGPVTLSEDILIDNSVCTNPTNGQLQSSISGGSLVLAGGGSFNYEWSSTNGLTGLPLNGTTDGTTPLNLATLLGVSGIPGGTYTLKVIDNFSACGEVSRSFILNDPSPATQTVTTSSPLNICNGDAITIAMNNSENGVTYTILRNGIATANSFLGSGAGPFVMTFPSTGFVNNDIIQVRATNGFCTPVTMTNTVLLNINPLPTITGIVVGSVCAGNTSTNLNYTSTTGSPNQYSIDFDVTAEGQGFVDIVNAALPASPISITVPGGAVPGNYNALVSVRNNTTTCSSTQTPITVTIIANPTITLGANPSVCIGSATASLPYSATTGSPNQYSIDFNAGAEAQGFVDVVNVALPVSPISITIPGIAIPGTYNATLTVRNTGSTCSSSSQPITVTINPNPTITLGANPSVCFGSTTADLGYSATTGGANQFSINFNAAAEAQGFVDVVNAALPATPIVITVPGAAVAGTYNATLSVRNSATGCISANTNISVTIIPAPTITLGANPSICFGSASANLPYTATTGSPSQYSIDFNAAAEAQGFVDVNNIVLPASPIIITVPGAAAAGTYTGTLTVLNTVTGCISSPQAITVTIDPVPTITLGANPSVCTGSTTAPLGYSATSGSPNQYSIDFNAGAEAQGFVDVVNAVLPATPISITVPGAAAAGTYNATLTVRNTTTGCVSGSQAISVTIVASPTVTLGANPSVCVGSTTANLPYSATTASPDQYSINFNAAAEAQGFVDVVNAVLPATPIVITVPGAALAGTYNATLSVRNSLTGCISTNNNISVTIIANPTITLGANPSICIGSTTANLTYSATTGSPNQYSIDFNGAAEAQGFVDVTNVALPASPVVITVPGAAVAGTYNATITVRNTVTGCISISQPISVTINATPTITLGANPSVCTGSTTASLGYSATTGGPNQYSIDFNGAAEGVGFADVTNAALPASPISITVPVAATAGTYNATLIVRNSATGCVSASQPISVTIIPTPTITLDINPSVCVGSTTANLAYTATTASPDEYSIDFNGAAETAGFVDVVNAALTASPIVITVPGAAAAGVYNATLTVRNSVTGCISANQSITVTIVANPTITLGPNPSVCIGSVTANLGYSATTGSPNQYSIDFDGAAEGAGFTDLVNVALPASPIVITIPGTAVAGTYNGTLVVLNAVTGCVSASQPISVTIDNTPTITLGANPSVCLGDASADLGYSATTASPDQYSIDFDAAAESGGFVDVNNVALPASPISITIPGAAIEGTYNATLTVRNSASGCISSSQPITVTINPIATISGIVVGSVCAGSPSTNLNYSATTGTPDLYSIDFDAIAEGQGFVDIVNVALPASPIPIAIPALAGPGGYNAIITVTNSGSSCSSTGVPITVTILPNPTITLGPDPVVCEGSLTADLTYTATTGSPNQYSIDFDPVAEAAGFVDVVTTVLPASPISITIPGAAGVGIYNATLTVLSTSSTCSSPAQAITVTINEAPTITLGANPSVCSGTTTADLPYSATTGTPDQYFIDFSPAAEAQGFVDVTTTGLPASPIVLTVPASAAAGVYNATITVLNSTTGCSSIAQAITVTIRQSPTAVISGTTSICSGSLTPITINFTGTTPWTYQYTDGTTTFAGVTPVNSITFNVGPTSNTTYQLVSVTDGALPSCNGILSGTAAITVNQNPQTNLTVAVVPNPICSGGSADVTVANSEMGVSYQLRNSSGNVNVGSPVVGNGNTITLPTGPLTSNQTFNVLATAAGCASAQLTGLANVTVTGTINAALAVTAVPNPICDGSTTMIQITNSENGVLYQLRNDNGNINMGGQIPGTGGTINLQTDPLSDTTTFNVLASNGSCSIELTNLVTVNVNVNPDPTKTVTVVPDPICEGGSASITVAASQVGVTYQLRSEPGDVAVGSPVAGTGGLISMSTLALTSTTTFNILATSGACTPVVLDNHPIVTVSGVIDVTYAVTSSASPICQGSPVDILVADSDIGITYELRDASNVSIAGPIAGTGSPLAFNIASLNATTTFNVLASNGTCSIQLTDTETVNVDVAPDAGLTVGTTLNPLCVGGESQVTVAASQSGVTYQLRDDADDSNVGSPILSAGGTISFLTGALSADKTFNILATSGSCPPVELTQKATITVTGTINAGLVVNTSQSPICAGEGTLIRVLASEAGVDYRLRNNETGLFFGVAQAGNGGILGFPTGNLDGTLPTITYSVIADNGTCSIALTDTETITINPLPDVTLPVTAAPAQICSGSAANINITGTQNGVTYVLRIGTTVVATVVSTGGDISISTGALTASTTYNVLATSGTCSAQLSATPTVTVRAVGDPACGGGGSDCAHFSSIVPTIITQPSCNDRDAGEVSFSITRADGIASTFRVVWTYNGTNQTKFTSNTVSFDNLSSGLYQYTITDVGPGGQTCGPVDFFLDLKTQVTILDKEVISNVTCFGGRDGNVKLTVDGTSTGAYYFRYIQADGQESVTQPFEPGSPLPGGLPANDNDFIIIKVDQNEAFTCPDTAMVRIRHTYPQIDFAVASTEVTTCNGIDGAIQVTGIAGGNTTTAALQIRLKKEVPFSTDPSGYITVSDFEIVNAGAHTYTDLSQGNYIIDVRDESDCIRSKPIAIQAPGQVPLAFVDIVPTDASCANEGASGSIQVTINQPGIYQVAVSQDQVNVPADDQFVAYNSPSLPNVTFNNLIRGRYFLYIKSSTTQCPTRTDFIAIGGVYAVGDFDIISNCENVNLTLNNISGEEGVPFTIEVFNNNDKFFKIATISETAIPLSNSISINYTAPLTNKFLTEQGTYRFVMIQTQTTGAGTCTLVSDTVVYDIRPQIGIVLGQVKPSFPDPKRTGSIEVENIIGGTRFVSGTNELSYEISLSTADEDIVVFDWTTVKLNPQNKFSALFDYISPGVYRIKVRDATGCIRVQDVEITLDPSVYVPNIFTPNDDAINDEFEVLNLPLQGKHTLIVSNRWGNQVFSSNDYREGNFWNAEGASDGIYFYRLKVEGGETYSGWVEILRGNKP